MASVNHPTHRAATPGRASAAKASRAEAARPARGAKATKVAITEVAERFGWAPGSWQYALMTRADVKGDGDITCAELDAFLAKPKGVFTSANLTAVAKAVDAWTGDMPVDGFEDPNVRQLADRADFVGNHDGKLSKAEWEAEVTKIRFNDPKEPQWLPDMKTAVVRNSIATMTGEADPLKNGGAATRQLIHDYDVTVMNDPMGIPQDVTYLLSSEDLAARQAGGYDRSGLSVFGADPLYPERPLAINLSGTGFDRGHMRPAGDSPDHTALTSSFIRTNVTPQTPMLNQEVLAVVEKALRELAEATGGKAVVVSGSLFVDAKGNPDQDPQVAGTLHNQVGVPKYCYKAALLMLPDGKVTAMGLKFPNSQRLLSGADYKAYLAAKDEYWKVADEVKDLPPEEAKPRLEAAALKKAACFKKVFQDSRVAVDLLEKESGRNLFSDLPVSKAKSIEASKDAKLPTFDPVKYPYAAMVFGA